MYIDSMFTQHFLLDMRDKFNRTDCRNSGAHASTVRWSDGTSHYGQRQKGHHDF